MSIGFKSQTKVVNSDTCLTPSGTQPGDLLVAVATHDGTNIIIPPTGWTSAGNRGVIFNRPVKQANLSYLFVEGTPPASYTWALASPRTITIQRFCGFNNLDQNHYIPLVTTVSSQCIAPNLTLGGGDSLVVFGGLGFGYNQSIPAGYTNADFSTIPNTAGYLIASKIQSGGQTGTATSTNWSASAGRVQKGIHLIFSHVPRNVAECSQITIEVPGHFTEKPASEIAQLSIEVPGYFTKKTASEIAQLLIETIGVTQPKLLEDTNCPQILVEVMGHNISEDTVNNNTVTYRMWIN